MNTSASASDVVSLPKGGGAIKGIGETFQANLFDGTGSHTIPIAVSPGRGGFGPSLSLQYSSGNANGPFGLGWELSIPRITRKTEKGLPRYDDTDVFVMSGAEDLVPFTTKHVDPLTGDTSWQPAQARSQASHTVHRYRPRTEGLFARIERWQHHTNGDVHWRATTKDNITSIYGATTAARIADPENPRRVYEWLLEETFDAVGNHIRYEYAKDDPGLYTSADPAVRLPGAFNRNRNATQLYIRRIYYGNLPNPLVDAQNNPVTYPDGTEIGHDRGGRHYAFEVLFDYGDWVRDPKPEGREAPTKQPHPEPAPIQEQELFGADSDPLLAGQHNPVPIREDCFSSFRAGFEVRTLRRCRRVLMFHHFAELGAPTLVRSTDFSYHTNPETQVSMLAKVTVTGHERDSAGVYRSVSMPPVALGYSEFQPDRQRYQSLSAAGGDLPPRALNDPDYALVDLFGDGLPDVLHTGPAGFRYWRNLGGGRLDRPRVMAQVPAGLALSQRGVGFGDMAGDGRADLLVHSGPMAGFYKTTAEATWQTFKRYDTFPSFDLADPNVRLLDLTGDGSSDVLMTADQHLLWFECLGEKGFGAPKRIGRRHDLNAFPDVFFDDPAGRVRLADMTGDGLTDIVLVHNGRIDYWPNLGYGRFGTRVTMANAPRLDRDFDPKRLFLADLNGTGCADLVYVDFNRVLFWFNQSGNRWSDGQTISGTPRVSDVDSIEFADVFGTGTATLLWTYAFGTQRGGNYKALDFCGGVKPYVLNEMSNNMGATTRVSYAPSTKYALADEAGTPWVTRLPFPVQVVDKVEVIDHISRTKLVTTYRYHHGYFDGREREFRGFARVDQFDTETFEDFTSSSLHPVADLFTNGERSFHALPVETRTWFHTGIYFDTDTGSGGTSVFDHRELTNRLRREFYTGDTEAAPLDDHIVDTGDTPHEAYRALRGAVLRTEIYAHDGTAKAVHPYQVSDTRHRVHLVQPKGGNHHGVYFSSQSESVSYHYERHPADPRISHALTLLVDEFGNPLKTLAVGYGRRRPDPALPTDTDRHKQTHTLITYTENEVTNEIDDPLADPDNYRTPLPARTRTYELTGYTPTGTTGRFSLEEWAANDFAMLDQAAEIGYEAVADPATPQKRLIEHVCTRYRKDDLTALLPVGELESLALPGESYKLAFTPQLLTQVFQRDGQALLPNPADVLGRTDTDRGGYVGIEGNWWIPSGRIFYTPVEVPAPEEREVAERHFFQSRRTRDPFDHNAVQTYDPYDLLIARTTDPVGNTISAEHDYRVLQPFRVTDPNGNRAEVIFDILGFVAGTAVMGKTTETQGDSLAGFEPNLTTQQLDDFMDQPGGHAAEQLSTATTRIVYDLDRFHRTHDNNPNDKTKWEPGFAATVVRETHVTDLATGQNSTLQISFGYSDGFGREIQQKIPAEPGPVPTRNPDGKIIVDADGQPAMTPDDRPTRWVGTGWTIVNNKAKPVRQFEPFITDTHRFEFDVRIGVSPTLFYDPLERVVATLHPNHTWEKTAFDAWRQETWDANDTILIADPKTDLDVGDFFGRLPDHAYLPTWHAQRQPGSTLNEHEQAAAIKAAAHANTPTTAHLDTLGRPYLSVAHNKVICPGHALHDTQAWFHTRLDLDIEGNQRQVRDADQQANDPLGRIAMRYAYDMLGNRIHQLSMEAGARWTLHDVTGSPIRGWDSRGHTLTTSYDPLRRPLSQNVRGTTADSDPRTLNRDILVQTIQYGEPATPAQEAEAQRLNLRTRIYRHCDSAGTITNARLDPNGNPTAAYDFKGNLLHSTRQLAADYKDIPDWQPAPGQTPAERATELLDTETFQGTTRYDALNRLTQTIAPHSDLSRAKRHITQPVYNAANLLERIDVWLDHDTEPTTLLDPQLDAPTPTLGVTGIDYNAKGQRQRIDYKNGASTRYDYDPLTFRLTHLYTRRGPTFTKDCDDPPTNVAPETPPAGRPCALQNLHYTYDPAGNITHIHDQAQQTLFFHNHLVEPNNDFNYDALYRLIQATGREHLGQTAGQTNPPTAPDAFNTFHTRLPHPNQRDAMGTYTEQYEYDAVGNFQTMRHHGHQPSHEGWTRHYRYDQDSLIENGTAATPLKKSNRLSSTTLDPNGARPRRDETYAHDAHGNMTSFPHLPLMQWNYLDQLQATSQQVVNTGTPETTYYVYDVSGERVRKVTEHHASAGQTPERKQERIYLGACEIHRVYENDSATATLERETLHITDDQKCIALVETRTLDTSGTDPAPQRLIRYQIGTHLGSVSLELDHEAQIITYEEYAPYGSTTYQGVRSQLETPKRYRYTAMERDEETELGYHDARYYAAWLGRWTAVDPSGTASGPNLYLYASDNPPNLVDTDGKEPSRKNTLIGNDPAGRAYENAWRRHFESRHDTGLVLKYTRWKDPATMKSKLVLGRWRNPDLFVEWKATPGRGMAVEVGSPPSFSSQRKVGQLAQDAEAISQGLVLGNKKTGPLAVDESFQARGLPIVGEGGNVPGSPRVRFYEPSERPSTPRSVPTGNGTGGVGKISIGHIGATMRGAAKSGIFFAAAMLFSKYITEPAVESLVNDQIRALQPEVEARVLNEVDRVLAAFGNQLPPIPFSVYVTYDFTRMGNFEGDLHDYYWDSVPTVTIKSVTASPWLNLTPEGPWQPQLDEINGNFERIGIGVMKEHSYFSVRIPLTSLVTSKTQ